MTRWGLLSAFGSSVPGAPFSTSNDGAPPSDIQMFVSDSKNASMAYLFALRASEIHVAPHMFVRGAVCQISGSQDPVVLWTFEFLEVNSNHQGLIAESSTQL